MLAVFHAREHLALGGPVAFELVCNDHTRHVGETLEQLPDECLRDLFVPLPLDQNIAHHTVLIDGAPQRVTRAVNRQTHFIHMLPIAWSGAPPELIGILLATFAAPLPERFVGHDYPTDAQECFDIAVADRKAKVQLDRVADDLPGNR